MCSYKAAAMKHPSETYSADPVKKRKERTYRRNHLAVTVLWAVFSCIFLILNIVVFAQPQWVGDTGDSAIAGFFGVWEYCSETSMGDGFICSGDFLQWESFMNSYFRATAIMVGASCIMFMLVIICFFLFCLLDKNKATVLRICATLQILSGLLMMVSCIIFPGGWDERSVKDVCGLQSGSYEIGVCEMRWGYALAIVLVFDAFILAILALVLAAKYVRVQKDGNQETELFKK